MALKLAGTSSELSEEERKEQEGYVVTEAVLILLWVVKDLLISNVDHQD